MIENSPKLQKMLQSSLLFEGASPEALDFVVKNLKICTFKKGDPVNLEGEVNDHVYFVNKGAIEITKYNSEVQEVRRVLVLTPGSNLYEFSVLNPTNKVASSFALEDSELYRLDSSSFLVILHQFPQLGRSLAQKLSQLLIQSYAGGFIQNFEPASLHPTAEILKAMPPQLWKKYHILPLSYHGGVLHIAMIHPQQTEFLDHCNTAGVRHIHISQIQQEDFDQTLRKLSFLSANPSSIESFRSSDRAAVDYPDITTAIKNHRYFSGLSESGLSTILPMFESVAIEPGEWLFNPGEPADAFYILQSGRLESNRPFGPNPDWRHVLDYDVIEGICDAALVAQQAHSYGIRATLKTTVAKAPLAQFQKLMTSGAFCLNLCKVLARQLELTSDGSIIRSNQGEKPDLEHLAHLIPKQEMQKFQILPLRMVNNEITVGVVNPSEEALYSIAGRYLNGYKIKVEKISADNFRLWMSELGESGVHEAASMRPVVSAQIGNSTVNELNKLLLDGYETRASDLHLEPAASGYSVRYRVDGVLAEVATRIPIEVGESIINRIKVLSKLDISNRFTPQDGQLRLVENGKDFTARVSTMPTKRGEGAVLRLVRSRNAAVPLSVLVPDTRTIRILKSITRASQGLFLVTGPTGSGKTTTLYSMIAELNSPDVKIISLEDPVELEIAGTSQIEINDRQGLTFEKALRSTLRQDPDVMVVGEIRDAESAKIVFEAALSGHLVISTLHTNNSFGVKSRLKELSVPLGTLGDGLIGSMAQRLVRAICKKCRFARPIMPSERAVFIENLDITKAPEELMEGRGCMMCNHTGYHGRLPIMEIWRKDRHMEDLIASDASLEDMLTAARADGFDTLYEFGLKMVLNGLTTLDEVQRCMGVS